MIDSTLKIQLLTNSFLHSLPLTCVFVAFILLLSFSSLHFISPLSAGNSGQFSPGYCIKCKSHCIRIFLPFLCVSKCFVCFFFSPLYPPARAVASARAKERSCLPSMGSCGVLHNTLSSRSQCWTVLSVGWL